MFIRRKGAERFIDEVRRDEPKLASWLQIQERVLAAGGRNELKAPAPRLARG